MALPDKIQICPVCKRENDIEQAAWRPCCLRTFEFGSGKVGMMARVTLPEGVPVRWGIVEVKLYLRHWLTDDHGLVFLTFPCDSMKELDADIEVLQRGLRAMREQARQVLKYKLKECDEE